MEVFMPCPNVNAVESYINGLKNKDLNNVPFAPDVTFESPHYDPRPITEAMKV
jgi:hypothetical protein